MILALALLPLSLGLGGYGLYEPHEGHFASVAREMVLSGDWVTPTLNGAPYLNKPPLLYWLSATGTALLGFTEYAARLPLALSGWLGAVVAWKWARELWNPASGRIAALMLCVACGWFMFTHQLLIDVLLSTLLLATYYCLWRLAWNGGWVYFFALYLLLGLCVLAKGPFMLAFPLLGCVGLALSRRNREIFKKLRPVLGIVVTSLVVLPWALAVEKANPGFLSYFLFNENLKRIADTRWPPDYEVSKVSALGYLAVTAVWCLPWTLVLPQAIRSAWQDWKQGSRGAAGKEDAGTRGRADAGRIAEFNNSPRLPISASTRQERSDSPHPQSKGVLLLVIAAAAPILLFLPLSSRLVYYSIPSIAPVAILCAGWWSRCHQRQRRERIPAGMGFCLLGLAACSAAFWAPTLVTSLPKVAHVPSISLMTRAIALLVGSGSLIGGIWLLLLRPHRALAAILLGLVGAYLVTSNGFAAFQDFRSSKTLVETAHPHLGNTTLWTFEGSRELGAAGAMSYYLDRRGHALSEVAGETRRHGDAETRRRGNTPHSPTSLPPGWAKGQQDTAYRIVMVLTDGERNRLPPQFPGPQPDYAITQRELQAYWDSSRPVVFVTDFLRQPNDSSDPPELNLPDNAGEPLLVVGPRKLYGNPAARERFRSSRQSEQN